VERGSFLHTVASTVQTLAFDHLDAPVVAPNRITPAPELEGDFFPQPSWIVDAIHERIVPLPGHVSASNQTESEIAQRARLGV